MVLSVHCLAGFLPRGKDGGHSVRPTMVDPNPPGGGGGGNYQLSNLFTEIKMYTMVFITYCTYSMCTLYQSKYSTQSNEVTRGHHWVSPALSFIGGVHIGPRALLDKKFDMVWLCRSPIQVGRRGAFSSFKWFYLPLLHLQDVAGGRHPVVQHQCLLYGYRSVRGVTARGS